MMKKKLLIRWLFIVEALIAVMIFVGGVTRLTESGLSMVEWKPILGVFPPTNDVEWQEAFDLYKQYPEYQVRQGMSLTEFKGIYFWEYLHRMLGRLIGLVYALPFFYFWARGYVSGRLKWLLGGGLILGGLQGLMGWYMVKSGLVDQPYVSHLRLAVHLLLAMFVFAYLQWVIMLLRERQRPGPSTLKGWTFLLLFIMTLQIIYGAFTAGLDGARAYNSWPLFNGSWVPPGVLALEPLLRNFYDNNGLIMVIHRSLAWVLFGLYIFVAVRAKRLGVSRGFRDTIKVGHAAFGVQILLGIGVLHMTRAMHDIPVLPAALHQLNAVVILAVLVSMHYRCTLRSPS